MYSTCQRIQCKKNVKLGVPRQLVFKDRGTTRKRNFIFISFMPAKKKKRQQPTTCLELFIDFVGGCDFSKKLIIEKLKRPTKGRTIARDDLFSSSIGKKSKFTSATSLFSLPKKSNNNNFSCLIES